VIPIRGSAEPQAIVTINNLPMIRLDDYFYLALPLDNSANAQSTDILISALVPGSTLSDPDEVDEASGFWFTPKTPELFTHDEDGNLTADGRWIYTWDGENRLIKMTKSSTVEQPMELIFTYDESSRRTTKTVVRGTGQNAR